MICNICNQIVDDVIRHAEDTGHGDFNTLSTGPFDDVDERFGIGVKAD